MSELGGTLSFFRGESHKHNTIGLFTSVAYDTAWILISKMSVYAQLIELLLNYGQFILNLYRYLLIVLYMFIWM